MPVDQATLMSSGQRSRDASARRHGDGSIDAALQSRFHALEMPFITHVKASMGARRQLHDLFGRIEHEFEKVYAENLALREKLDQMTEKLVGSTMADKTDSSVLLLTATASPSLAVAADEAQKSAKKGSQLSQKLKSTYKTSTTKIANTFRMSGSGRFVRDFVGHTDGVWEVNAAMRHGVRTLVSASADGTAKVWSADTGLVLLEYCGHRGSVNSARLHPFKNVVVTASGDRTAHVWPMQTSLLLLPGGMTMSPLLRPVMSPNSSFVGLSSLLARRSQSLPTGDSVESATMPPTNGFHHGSGVAARAGDDAAEPTCDDACTEPDVGIVRRGESLPFAAAASCLRVPLTVLGGHADVVSAADWLCDGSRIVTASWDGTAAAHDVEHGSGEDSVVETFLGHERELTNVSTHGTQKLVLTASKDMSVRLWDLRLPSVPVNAFLGHTATVSSAVFAPHDRIVSGSDDRTVKLWDMRNMAAPYTTIRGDSAVNRLSVCPSTGTLAVPYDNRHIRLFDVTTGARLGRMPRSSRTGHSRMVSSTAWLEDGPSTPGGSGASSRSLACNLLSAGFDGRILGWRANPRSS